MGLEVFINDNQVTLSADSVVALNKQIVDLNTFGEIKTDFSTTFTLAPVAENIATLEGIQALQSGSSLPYTKIPAKIVQDGLEVVTGGSAIVETVAGGVVKVTVFSGNFSWSGALKEKKLQDVDLSDLSHLWDTLTVSQSNQYERGYVYPPIEYGSGSNHNAAYLRPWVFVRELLPRIFKAIGYSITGDVLTSEDYLGLAVECSQNKAKSTELKCLAQVNDGAGFLDLVWDDNTGLESRAHFPDFVRDPWAPISTPGLFEEVPTVAGGRFEFICRKTGLYTIKTRWKVQHLGATTRGGVFYPYGSSAHWVARFITTAGPGVTAADISIINAGTPPGVVYTENVQVVSLVKGNRFSLLLQPINGLTGAGIGHWAIREFNGSSFEVTEVQTDQPFEFGDKVNLSDNLPDLDQASFVKSVAFFFGCAIIPDVQNKTVAFRYWNELQKNKEKAPDWSNFINWNKAPEVRYRFGSWAQRNWFRWTPDDTVPEFYGDGFLEISDAWLSPERTVYTQPFAATVTGVDGFPVIKRSEISGELWVNDVVPRLLMIERRAGSFLFVDPNSSGLNQTTTAYAFPFFKVLGGSRNIGYDDRLLADYYAFADQMTAAPQVLTLELSLPAFDIYTFDPFTPVYLKPFGAFYFVNKVTNWRKGAPAKVELVKI